MLRAIPELVASKASYGVILSYNVNIVDVLLAACKQNSDDDAKIVMRSCMTEPDFCMLMHAWDGTQVNGCVVKVNSCVVMTITTIF